MAAFLQAQLDFIFFFYGLAFILLGAVCFAIVRGGGERSWTMLGLFGFVHGGCEWLDLAALVLGDNPAFAVARIAIMGGSYLFLIEFARRDAVRLGWNMPSHLLYTPLVLAFAFAVVSSSPDTANVITRYTLGFVGATATSCVFASQARKFSGPKRLGAIGATLGFALYAVAAGVITPTAPFWPATVLNYEWFLGTTGIPIQLVRGLLACSIACSVWAIWGNERIVEVSSARYAAHVQRQFASTLAAMAATLISGWLLTEYLGDIYERNVETQSRGEIDLLSSRLTGETTIPEVMVKLLADAPSVQALASNGTIQVSERLLNLAVEASGAKGGAILNKSGTVVAGSGSLMGLLSTASSNGLSLFLEKSINGEAGSRFAFDPGSGNSSYFASYPIRGEFGEVVGCAVLEKSLERFATDLKRYGRTFFMIDPDGIVVLTNRPEAMFRTMWPLPSEDEVRVARQFGEVNNHPMMTREVSESAWVVVDGARDFVRRHYVNHSQWSLVILQESQEIFASRLLGIATTFVMTIFTLAYLLGRERAIHDHVQMEKRLELQKLASDMRFRATTDTLTGLNNRLRFNEAIALEISRSQRYGTPFSLVLYDIDHFKAVNDAHGHLTGDKVLVQLSKFVAGQIRAEDVIARWGGEEFAILLPETNMEMASRFAEKLKDSICKILFEEVGPLTCSFGIAELEDGDTAKTLVARADTALYQAKLMGRNRVERSSKRPGPTQSRRHGALMNLGG